VPRDSRVSVSSIPT